ncbi:hypothetical protein [Brenneria alni]|nr:hypothetical protein [Brenneria alni]
MARPSILESQPAFALQNEFCFAFRVAVLFAFRQLSTETTRFY